MAQQRPHGTRRVWLPAAAFGLFAAAIGVRLVQLQVLEHDYYAAKAREELLGNDTIYAQRGTILDRNGGVLATSVTTWDIYVNVRVWKDDAAANKAAAELAPFLKTQRPSGRWSPRRNRSTRASITTSPTKRASN